MNLNEGLCTTDNSYKNTRDNELREINKLFAVSYEALAKFTEAVESNDA
jgi:hypothetical protein